jgi:catechol 2,3-dioxygenase-like lactoylglutathione lyase family enzyme
MFDHVTIRVSGRAAATAFYDLVLAALDVPPAARGAAFDEWDDFSLAQADDAHPVTRGLHVGFVAPSPAAVDAFWAAGRAAGAADAGAPGPRPQYKDSYYGAFLRDPDGNSVEAVHHDDVRRGGHVDHLWVGVADLDRAARFYAGIAPHAGIRPGASWDTGRQFRGPWATMALVADGRPPTTGLHIAFPAPDRETVAGFHAAALAAGGRDNGGPGERPEYHAGYYGAFVLDPDGTNVESVLHCPRG